MVALVFFVSWRRQGQSHLQGTMSVTLNASFWKLSLYITFLQLLYIDCSTSATYKSILACSDSVKALSGLRSVNIPCSMLVFGLVFRNSCRRSRHIIFFWYPACFLWLLLKGKNLSVAFAQYYFKESVSAWMCTVSVWWWAAAHFIIWSHWCWHRRSSSEIGCHG